MVIKLQPSPHSWSINKQHRKKVKEFKPVYKNFVFKRGACGGYCLIYENETNGN